MPNWLVQPEVGPEHHPLLQQKDKNLNNQMES